MLVELHIRPGSIAAMGAGDGEPLRLDVSRLVIRNRQGTPIGAAGEYGPEGAQMIARAGDTDFDRVLEALGVSSTPVRVDRVGAVTAARGP